MSRAKTNRKNKMARRRYKLLQRALRDMQEVAFRLSAKLRSLKTELTKLPPLMRVCCHGCTLPVIAEQLKEQAQTVANSAAATNMAASKNGRSKAISIKQPWASMIAGGKKRIETRPWSTKYRGPIYIVSSLKADMVAMLDLDRAGVIDAGDHMPRGFALAKADIIDCREMTEADEAVACCKVYPKAHSLVLKNIVEVDPFPVKGKLGIYEIEVPR